MPIEKLLPFLSFAFGVVGFIRALIPPVPPDYQRAGAHSGDFTQDNKHKRKSYYIWLGALLVVFSATSAAFLWQNHQRSAHIQNVAEKITSALGKERKSIDQIQEGLPFEGLGTISEALSLLVEAKKVDSAVEEIRDKANLRYTVRFFYNQ